MAGRGGEMSKIRPDYGYTFGDGRVITNLLEGETIRCADHVSKKALREWCEENLNICNSSDSSRCYRVIYEEILDQFCKEGES